jgi:hypothetical protein
VPAGEITFEPDATAGNQGPAGYAKIADGQYDTRKTGKGTVGGPHVVRITGMSAGAKSGSDDAGAPPLFPEYQTKVDLEKGRGTKDFSVPAEAAQAAKPGKSPLP